eukprot:817282-Rhodomonas_salina.2
MKPHPSERNAVFRVCKTPQYRHLRRMNTTPCPIPSPSRCRALVPGASVSRPTRPRTKHVALQCSSPVHSNFSLRSPGRSSLTSRASNAELRSF